MIRPMSARDTSGSASRGKVVVDGKYTTVPKLDGV